MLAFITLHGLFDCEFPNCCSCQTYPSASDSLFLFPPPNSLSAMFGSSIKNLSVSIDRLNDRNTFSSGDQVTGHISFEITKQTKITSITVALSGVAHVHWSSGGGGGRGNRKHYSAIMKYFNYRGVILQENGAIRETTKLSPGTHVYPFTCQLPQGDFPSTFHGPQGKIVYTLKVDIYRPWHLSKNFETELNFVHHIDTNLPYLWAPLSGTNSMTLCCLCCASGPLTMTATVEKKAFIPGETVKINCDISNGSFKTATPKARLEQKQTLYTQGRERHREVVKRFKSVSGEPVAAHTSDVYTELKLTIPSSAYLTVSNCSILVVDYIIEVSLCVRAFPDITVLVPIILYDGSAHTNSPPSS